MDQAKKGFLSVLQGVKLSQTQCLATAKDREKMKVIPYASAIGSIMYAMLCTRPDVCLVQKLVKINMVDDMACSINGFRPELSRSLVFIEHRLGHLNECSVLAFHDAILLRRVRS